MYPLISVFIIVVGALLLVFANKIIKNIYNVDTGKLVVGGNLMNEEVSYTDEDWEKTF